MFWCLQAQQKAKVGQPAHAAVKGKGSLGRPTRAASQAAKSGLLSAQMAGHDDEEGDSEGSHG